MYILIQLSCDNIVHVQQRPSYYKDIVSVPGRKYTLALDYGGSLSSILMIGLEDDDTDDGIVRISQTHDS